MAAMTILEAAEHFGVSKEAIHNRVRRGSLVVTLKDGVKMVEIDGNAKPATKSNATTTRRTTTNSAKTTNDKYYRLLEEQNAQLQTKVEKLEGETRSLRDQKEDMLIQERIKIEQIYKEKDEQLKNILSTISSQFMLNAPVNAHDEEHFDAEIEAEEAEQEKSEKGELISLKKYMKNHGFSEKKREKVKNKFLKKAKKDERIIIISSKFYVDTIKYDYSDLM